MSDELTARTLQSDLQADLQGGPALQGGQGGRRPGDLRGGQGLRGGRRGDRLGESWPSVRQRLIELFVIVKTQAEAVHFFHEVVVFLIVQHTVNYWNPTASEESYYDKVSAIVIISLPKC